MFYQPATLDDVLELKSQLGADGTLVAGGTDLVVLASRGLLQWGHVIDLSHVHGLAAITEDNGQYRLGGATTHARLEELPVRGLAYAASTVGGVQIRNRGTVAGNIATASPAGDVSTALLALDADLELARKGSRRRLPLREFFLGYKRTALQPDEAIVAVRCARSTRHAFVKYGKREATAISVVCGAAGWAADGRIFLACGSVGPFPMRLPRTEEFLAANGLEPASIAEAGRMASQEVTPIDDHRASAEYRRALVAVAVRRLLEQLQTSGG